MGVVQRIRDSATIRDVKGLLAELQPHLGDTTIVECALKGLATLAEEGLGGHIFDVGGAEVVVQALKVHGSELRFATCAVSVLASMLADVDQVVLSASALLSDMVAAVVNALDAHAADRPVFFASCDLL
jgi:hypothetical protein